MASDGVIRIEVSEDGATDLVLDDSDQRLHLLSPTVFEALQKQPIAVENRDGQVDPVIRQGVPAHDALLHVFCLRNRNRENSDAVGDSRPFHPRLVGVLGAGTMGQGIAVANVKQRVPVMMSDASEEALNLGLLRILEEVACDSTMCNSVSCNAATRTIQMPGGYPLLRRNNSDAELGPADLIIESIIEDRDAKKRLFARIEPRLRDDAILCSNTSTIPITELAEDLTRPEQFCGLHFFNPVRLMAAVEVVRGEKTSDETVATVVAYARRLGKCPIVVGDAPGFLVNRVLLPYLNEALQLVVEGASLYEIDDAATTFGMPIGPIGLLDLVGLDTAAQAGLVLYKAYPDRIIPSRLLVSLFKSGRLGLKNGRGFYTYQGAEEKGGEKKSRNRLPAQHDPEVETRIAEHVRRPRTFTQDTLVDRLILPMVLEATRVLEAGLVRNPRDVDLGLIFGIGFPPFRGGLLYWVDRIGAAAMLERLRPFEELGRRYEPTDMLRDMAASGGRFYR